MSKYLAGDDYTIADIATWPWVARHQWHDIGLSNYPGKLKLILSGFHEGALAARACFKLARPNEKYRFEFTTTSKSMHERLGVKKSD